MIQEIIIGILFIAAIVHIGRLVYKNFQARSGCATGCGKCGAIDFDKIEAQIQKQEAHR